MYLTCEDCPSRLLSAPDLYRRCETCPVQARMVEKFERIICRKPKENRLDNMTRFLLIAGVLVSRN